MAAGTFTTATLTADDAVLSNLKVGDTYYKCTAAGFTSFFHSQAYGKWEFSWKKVADAAGSLIIKFISQDQLEPANSDNGYYVLHGNKTFTFAKLVAGAPETLFSSNNTIMPDSSNTWYSLRVQRSIDNFFYVFLKGGEFGDNYSLLTATSGSNPVQDSEFTSGDYITLSVAVGDGFMWTPDERLTSIGGTQFGVNPLIEAIPKTAGAVSLNV